MADKTKIEWSDHTWNPWLGCTKVHIGCKHCYAEDLMDKRFGSVKWGPHGTRVRTSDANWRKPIKWNREASVAGVRRRVFASLCDPFELWDGQYLVLDSRGHTLWRNETDREIAAFGEFKNLNPTTARLRYLTLDNLRADMFQLIDSTPDLDWLLLTKRPENVRRMWHGNKAKIDTVPGHEPGTPEANIWHRENVWLLYSASDQQSFFAGWPYLLSCRDLVPVLGLSLEPLVGPVDLNGDNGWLVPWGKSDGVCGPDVWNGLYVCDVGHSANRYLKTECGNKCLAGHCDHDVRPAKPGVDWVIVGGESGPNARPCDVAWVRDIVRQCRDAAVPCFVKQLGSRPVVSNQQPSNSHWPGMRADPRGRTDGLASVILHDPKGGDPDEWPEDLRVRQFPKD